MRKQKRWDQTLSRWLAVTTCLLLMALLLLALRELPEYGARDSPIHNEVSDRYLQQGLAETGASNLVSGIILDYRAFDTFGESSVLFVSVLAVLILLRQNPVPPVLGKEETRQSPILKGSAILLLPFLLLYGCYVVLNGHLSPGGGFSGGVLIGAGGILASASLGSNQVRRVLSYRRFLIINVSGILLYGVLKLYVFYCGGNGIDTHIPLGSPGTLFSAGLIPILNCCIGMVVASTIYGFYTLFRHRNF